MTPTWCPNDSTHLNGIPFQRYRWACERFLQPEKWILNSSKCNRFKLLWVLHRCKSHAWSPVFILNDWPNLSNAWIKIARGCIFHDTKQSSRVISPCLNSSRLFFRESYRSHLTNARYWRISIGFWNASIAVMDSRRSKPPSCNFSTQTSLANTLFRRYRREQLRVC